MSFGLGDLIRLAGFSVTSPREAARSVLAMDLPAEARWIALALAAVGAAMLTSVEFALLPEETRVLFGNQTPSPLISAAIQGAILLAAAFLIHRIGVWRGGQGSFADTLLLVAWLQCILLGCEALQLLVHLVAPGLSEVIGVAGIVLFFWLLTHFVVELHGFRSTVAVFGGILLAFVAIGFALALFLMPLMGA